jgi:peptidoglycan/xylan/chitin deacetylase (PgdA/CDA1 family)
MSAGWRPAPLVRLSLWLHAAAVAAVIAWPGAWRLVLAVVVADHLTLVAASLWPRSTLIGPNLRRLPAAAAAGATALTFDDGPDPVVTPAVLDLLGRYNAHASFFCVGHRAEAAPELVAEIVRRGHRVENHSHRHSNLFCFLGPSAAGREIDRAQEVLAQQAGERPSYFRAPAGLRNPWLAGVLAARGLALASWTRRGFDTASADPEAVLRRLTRALAAGDILLLHDRAARPTRGGRPVVLAVLPRLLDELERRGLAAVALPPPRHDEPRA